jgi:uncharacterized protein (TIGR02266 family)
MGEMPTGKFLVFRPPGWSIRPQQQAYHLGGADNTPIPRWAQAEKSGARAGCGGKLPFCIPKKYVTMKRVILSITFDFGTSMNQELDQPKPQSDQRKTLRSPLIVLKVKVDEGKKSLFGYAKNISRSGVFIATVNPREPGSRFMVEISLPEPVSRTTQCQCEVVWKRHFSKKSPYEPGMGLRFLDMPADTAEAIDLWVKSQEE